MKQILLIFLMILLTAPAVFSMPDYDPAQRDMPVIVYGVEEAKYNKELFERLDKEFMDKYFDEHGAKPGLTPNSYANEVVTEFNKQKKLYNY